MKLESKHFYQSKVFWFNTLFVIVALAGYFGFTDYQPDSQTAEIAAVVISVVNMGLRFLTKTELK